MRCLLICSLAVVTAAPLSGQATPRITTLTLEDAITIAKQNNAQYLQVASGRHVARAGLRQAYAALGPSVTSGLDFSWREGRQEYFAGQPIGSAAATLGSGYSIGVSAAYSYQSLLAPKTAGRRLDASDATVTEQEQQLRLTVTNQYITVIELEKAAQLQDSLVSGQRLQVDLAKAKETAGSGTLLDTKTAELSLSRALISALTARNRVAAAKIALFVTLGVPYPGDVTLTTTPPQPVEPTFRADELLAQARASHPGLAADRADEQVASLERRATVGNYLFPSLSLSTGIGGSTNMRSNATGAERTWPWDFERSPISFRVGLGYTIWDRYNREANMQQRTVAAANARNALRQRELQIASGVTTALLDLQLAWQTIALQDQAVNNAREALAVGRARYEVGSTTFLELTTASDNYQSAENARLGAVYNYHRAFAALEAAVGRSLR